RSRAGEVSNRTLLAASGRPGRGVTTGASVLPVVSGAHHSCQGVLEGCIAQVYPRKILPSWPRPTRVPHAARGERPMYHNGSTLSCLPARTGSAAAAQAGDAWTATPPPAEEAEDIRPALVERARREIEAGTYDPPERWEAALERLARRLIRR